MLALLIACGPGACSSSAEADGAFENLRAEATDVPTVFVVRWESLSAEVGAVVGEAGTFEENAATTEHSVVVRGLRAGITTTVGVEMGAESTTLDITAGPMEGDLPPVTGVGSGDAGGWITTSFLGSVYLPVILAPDGEPVWWYADERGLQTYRSYLSNDGEGVLYNAAAISGEPVENSAIVKRAWGGELLQEWEIPKLSHDFVELPDGTIAAVGAKDGELDGQLVRGDAIYELSADGTYVEVWDTWDCFDPATTGALESEHGWTFSNALDYDADRDQYLLGSYNFSSIIAIDRATGECAWVFGDVGATFAPAEGSATFHHQHQFERTPEGTLLVFDNEGAGGSTSRVVEYDFDPEAGVATERWSYMTDPPVYTAVLGEPQRYDDGGTLITWSFSGRIDHVGANGEAEWTAGLELGYIFGFARSEPGL